MLDELEEDQDKEDQEKRFRWPLPDKISPDETVMANSSKNSENREIEIESAIQTSSEHDSAADYECCEDQIQHALSNLQKHIDVHRDVSILAVSKCIHNNCHQKSDDVRKYPEFDEIRQRLETLIPSSTKVQLQRDELADLKNVLTEIRKAEVRTNADVTRKDRELVALGNELATI